MPLRFLLSNFLQQAARARLGEMLEGRSPAAEPEIDPATLEPPHVVVLCAMGIEAGGFIDRLRPTTFTLRGITCHYAQGENRPIAVLETGMGEGAARRGCLAAIEAFQPGWVVTTGFAGGLADGVSRGHFLMADRLRHTAGGELRTGLKLTSESPGLHIGALLTTNHMVTRREEKARLAEEYGAAACDMESYAVGEACRETGVRCMAVRIISDGWYEEIPPEIAKLSGAGDTTGKIGAAAGTVWRRPAVLKEMWQLRDRAVALSDRLAGFLAGVISQLEAADPPANPSAPE